MKQSKIQHYTRAIVIFLLHIVRGLLFFASWFFCFGVAFAAIFDSAWIWGIIIAVVGVFLSILVLIAFGKLIECINSRNDKKINLNTEKIKVSKLELKKAECESVCNELEECEQQENANIGVIWANHYRERNDYTNLAELCKLGDIVAMYDMAQFFYNLCNEEEQQLIKNYELNPCDATENKLRETMNYSKKDKFEPENNRMGYYMMWLVRAAMYGNEKAIELTEKCSCYKRKASIPYDFYLGKSSTMDFNISNFLSDGGFSDVPPAEKDCTLKRYGNIYKLTYLSYYDSADPDGYGSETEYSNVYYDEFFMKLDTKQKNEIDRITRASMTAEESVKEIFAEGRKREKAIETNERIREEYWENQTDCDERKYKSRLECTFKKRGDNMDWHEAIKNGGQQQRLLNQAKFEEENNNLEAAFELYQQAAALGNGDAMVAIGNLYAVKNFRMKETYDFLEHVLQGSPLIMPYNLTKKQEPDLKTALEWYIKAAEQDHPDGCFAAGAMLCEGKGCESDVERGLMYLKKADEKGMPSARQVICIYDPTESLYLSDDEYEKLLERFVQAVDSCTLEQFELYLRLKGGTESQQTRLGYTLITRRNLEDPKYQSFKYLFSPEGIPLLPCCARRGAWKSFVRVDLNAFRSDDIYIAFATDISNSFVESSRLKPVGSAVYRSPAFGWLGEEKKSLVLKVDRTCVSQQIQEIAEEFGLLPKEYAEENAAFIVENGEKDYSVEFAVIENGKVHVLYRYTIGGPDEIHSSFEPELISLTIDKYDADTINKETNGVSEECEQQENASKSIDCANHCRKNMRLKLINAICDPERSSRFKQRLGSSLGVEELSVSKFNRIMMTQNFLTNSVNPFVALLESDLLLFAYDSSPLSGEFMNIFFEHKELVKKTIFVIYASKEYFETNMSLIEQKAMELKKICPDEEINSHLYLINADNDGDIHFLLDGIWNFGTEKINVPRTEMNFNLMLKLQGKSVIDIQKDVTLPDIDFWADKKFVWLTKGCAAGDTYAMMALGNYYDEHGNNEFCRLASNYWYCNAFLYGNKEAKHWLAYWIGMNPGKRIPMPILPCKIYKTYVKMVHDNEHCYRGAMLKALGFGFFSEKRTYEMYHFFEPELVQFCSWCNTEGPDEDGFGMSEEYDWWFLDELFNELPDVKMLHSYSFHERQYACTETFDKQYENAKIALEIKRLSLEIQRLRSRQRENNL